MRILRSVLLACFALLAAPLFATPAKADFRVCNATQSIIGVAIGYRAAEGWKSEGWWNIEPATCQPLIEGALGSRFYYLYAEDGERGGRWDGPISMCIAERPFKIVGVNDCFQRGFQKAGFREYDTGAQSSWMVQLTDEPAPGATPTTPVTPAGPPPNEPPDAGPETGDGDAGPIQEPQDEEPQDGGEQEQQDAPPQDGSQGNTQ